MNNGRICISVCAETADALVEQIKRAENLADLIEIRFDCLKDDSQIKELFLSIENLRSEIKKPLLFTFRSKEQGGNKNLSLDKRKNFWSWRDDNKITFGSPFDNKTFLVADLIDLETDLIEDKNWILRNSNIFKNSKFYDYVDKYFDPRDFKEKFTNKIIGSYHDFFAIPKDINSIFTKLNLETIDIIKIAAQADDITDTIPIWKLLEKAKSENKEIIPIAMGESGKWTRILGLAHGAFLTYAALDSGKETAPGQVSARDLIEVYRAKELDENTDVYGIIAGNTSYTLSPYIHNAAFKFHQLNSVFIPLQVQNLDEFMRRMVLEKSREVELNFKGFAVTNPHKQAIIKYLDEIDETAEKIGAVNTVKIENGKLYGYNTDATGFIEPLKNVYGDLSGTKVAVFGAGGAARACIYALKKENAEVTIFARNPEKARNLAKEFDVNFEPIATRHSPLANQDIVINTTPLGTKGELENEIPVAIEQIKNIHLAYDLVYNPFETRFLRAAKSADIPTIGGLAMLIAQGAEQQKIWTNLDAPVKEMSRAALQKLR